MPDTAPTEPDLRRTISTQILTKFGALAPYKMVAEFVLKGPDAKIENDPTIHKKKKR